MFFFEKKNQKTFIRFGELPGFRLNELPDAFVKVFCFFFSKKKNPCLSSHDSSLPRASSSGRAHAAKSCQRPIAVPYKG
jgi:hypothetical protein